MALNEPLLCAAGTLVGGEKEAVVAAFVSHRFLVWVGMTGIVPQASEGGKDGV